MNVAFIPVRGGSKSIPLKNIRQIAGKPLVYWVASAASACPDIDVVYVATDSAQIAATVEGFGLPKVEVIGRSPQTASDTAPTESAMAEFVEGHEFDALVLIQATSPLLTADDLSRGFARYGEEGVDSVISGVEQKRFYWTEDERGARPLNYDYLHRPRRQDFEGCFVENGAFYITSREGFLSNGNRLFGRIAVCPMPEDTLMEIDEPSDWHIIEALFKRRRKAAVDIPAIKLFLTDSDGCLTDSGMYYSERGDELKRFSALDGMGFALLRKAGIATGIVTGESVDLVRRRAEKLHVDELVLGARDKLATVEEICRRRGISLAEVAYVGDDVNDLEVLRAVGFGCSVPNAQPEVRDAAVYVTSRQGGDGAVREVIDVILDGR